MNKLVVMGLVGVAVAAATAGGLLWMQGRLDYEGTRNIPLVRSLFEGPPETTAIRPVPPAQPAKSTKASRSPKPPELPGASKPPAGPPGRQQGADPAAAVSRVGDLSAAGPVQGATAPALPGMPGAHGFAPGELFDLRKLEATGFTVDQVNEMIARSRREQQQLAAERAALLRLRRELETREKDVEARYEQVSRLLRQVAVEQEKLDREAVATRDRVTALREDEVAALEATARTIARLTPSAGAELIVEFWQGEGGPDKVVKILAVMDRERADEILACLDTRRAREILDRRMSMIRKASPAPASTRSEPR